MSCQNSDISLPLLSLDMVLTPGGRSPGAIRVHLPTRVGPDTGLFSISQAKSMTSIMATLVHRSRPYGGSADVQKSLGRSDEEVGGRHERGPDGHRGSARA